MNRHSGMVSLPLGLALLVAGCGSDESQTSPPGPAPVLVNVTVDTDHDGWVVPERGDQGDELGEWEWSGPTGAAFLPNYDDDDGDGVPDRMDLIVNGPADDLDLARIRIQPWPDAPDGATGWLTLNDASVVHVRVFRYGEDTGQWTAVAGRLCDVGAPDCAFNHTVPLTTEEIRRGIWYGVEALHFVGTTDAETWGPVPWDGTLELRLEVFDKDDQRVLTEENPVDGIDWARMKVAPWLQLGNLNEFDTIYYGVFSQPFANDFVPVLEEAGMYGRDIQASQWNDRWVEDWFQTGFTFVPAPDGQVHGMKVAMPRPWGRPPATTLPIDWLRVHHSGPDVAAFEVCERGPDQRCQLHPNELHYGGTFDSHGNHELVPPFEGYPLGRIALGAGALPETVAFYQKQGVQPLVQVETAWLTVAHIDEIFAWVPANTERGWKVLQSSPELAREMMQSWSDEGHGSAVQFEGTGWDITIDEMLTDPVIAGWQQLSQGHIDGMVQVMRDETGVTDDDLIEIPLYFHEEYGDQVAYHPGMVNSQVFGDWVLIPEPHGPMINGVDPFKTDLEERLGTPVNQLGADGQGLHVRWVEDWTGYHVNLGEVHCAANHDALPDPEWKWWEVAQ